MNSFYRNWHKPSAWFQTKRKPLCSTFGPKVSKSVGLGNRVQIDFTMGDDNKQISFILTPAQAQSLKDQLNDL
jgi:hypothetical protein